MDVLWVLHDRILRVDPRAPDDPDRDRFLLSKGHKPMAYHAVLAAQGFLDPAALDTFGHWDSRLGHHPDRTLVPGVEIGSASLGHGLGLAVGTALRLRMAGRDARTVVLVGDAELDEGSNAEAIQYAASAGLDRLTAVEVDDTSCSHGWPGGMQTGSTGQRQRFYELLPELVAPTRGRSRCSPTSARVHRDTSTPEVSRALVDLRHRTLGLGVAHGELRRYGTRAEHETAHGIDAAGIRRAITGFLAAP